AGIVLANAQRKRTGQHRVVRRMHACALAVAGPARGADPEPITTVDEHRVHLLVGKAAGTIDQLGHTLFVVPVRYTLAGCDPGGAGLAEGDTVDAIVGQAVV